MDTLNLTAEDEARMMEALQRAHDQDELRERAVQASGLDGAPAGALRWLLDGFILDPDDGETAPDWRVEYVEALARRIAQDRSWCSS